jgi:hypothetical protein
MTTVTTVTTSENEARAMALEKPTLTVISVIPDELTSRTPEQIVELVNKRRECSHDASRSAATGRFVE